MNKFTFEQETIATLILCCFVLLQANFIFDKIFIDSSILQYIHVNLRYFMTFLTILASTYTQVVCMIKLYSTYNNL